MNLDNLFIDFMHYLARIGIAKSNMYKIFITEEFLSCSLLRSNLITKEELLNNKEIVIPKLQSKWLEIKDNL